MNIYDYTLSKLESVLVENGFAKFNASQIFQWLYKHSVSDFESMTNLSKKLRTYLNANYEISELKLVSKQNSIDGTIKYLFSLTDGCLVETVLMPQAYGKSVCVTTQVGCNMGCTFCASGLEKKKRDLTPGEMVQQVIAVSIDIKDRVSHVVIMGTGEPFDNYDNVISFINVINHDKGLGVGARHITVSTSGIVPKILAFANEPFQVNLAISLHAPNDLLRSSLMPINNKYNIEDLMDACNWYIDKTNRRITFEYILLQGVNDSIRCANKLADLLHGMNCYVNIIPYNVVEEFSYQQSYKDSVSNFFNELKKRAIQCNVRKEFGADIKAACGQLRNNSV